MERADAFLRGQIILGAVEGGGERLCPIMAFAIFVPAKFVRVAASEAMESLRFYAILYAAGLPP